MHRWDSRERGKENSAIKKIEERKASTMLLNHGDDHLPFI